MTLLTIAWAFGVGSLFYVLGELAGELAAIRRTNAMLVRLRENLKERG